MCGIFGFAIAPAGGPSPDSAKKLLRDLFKYSESRGKEAAGIAFLLPDRLSIHKDACPPSRLVGSREYRVLEDAAWRYAYCGDTRSDTPFAAIGHSRLVTSGLQGIVANNQPVAHPPVALVHNGIVVNVEALERKFALPPRRTDVDSEVIALLLAHFLAERDDLDRAIGRVFAEVVGEISLALLFTDRNMLVLATNTGSLYQAGIGGGIVFASEEYILSRALHSLGQTVQPAQIPAGRARVIDLQGLAMREVDLRAAGAAVAPAGPAIAPGLAIARRLEDSAERAAALRDSLRRCTRCVLPDTMPFISFDEHGVCSYCHSYRPRALKSRSELDAILAQYRRDDGRPDCLMAFSGGRDSSYGMHLLKRELDMNPIAFTYDWGMVTDIARRNQARMCGQLGVEHLWVSADIKAKRNNIRRNLQAWTRRPDLGMVPLLMAGDKHFFSLANQTMKRMDIRLMVWCMNDLERTDFKTGFAGIPPSWDQSRHYHLSLLRTAKIVSYYGLQYVLNPAYINRSLMDTFTAFLSYYLVDQNYVFLYDYLPWDESHVDETLLGEYGWETAKDTASTWRIGDGTAPFYNYVYLTVAGFSEHDTFRSNQIREGQITREQALAYIRRDNVPRWEGIREYLQMLNVDFGDVIAAVERMPKLYDRGR